MALIEVNFKPSKKDLTVFSIGGCLILFVAALILKLRHHGPELLPAILAGVGVALVISRFVSLAATKWIYLVFVVVTLPIGWTLSYTILFLFYYGLLMPVGLFFRCIGRDSLHRKLDHKATTYWVPHQSAQHKERYFRQF